MAEASHTPKPTAETSLAATPSSSSGSSKKSLFNTLFIGSQDSQELLNCDILAPNSTPPFGDDLTKALIKNEKMQRQNLNQAPPPTEEHDPPSPVIFKTPARSFSYEEPIRHASSQKKPSPPLPSSASDSSLKKRKSTFVDKFIRKTPSSSQKEISSSQSLSQLSSSQSSSSNEAHPPLKKLSDFLYELSSDEEITSSKKKQKKEVKQLTVEVVISSDDEDYEVDNDEKNVFELFMKYSD